MSVVNPNKSKIVH